MIKNIKLIIKDQFIVDQWHSTCSFDQDSGGAFNNKLTGWIERMNSMAANNIINGY